ncbi:MAG: heavy metal-binding domain-containing protein [Enterococcus sp.]|nr:heavy metal-binding domain-containing protein [Enterococcus sp.]
MAFCGRCGNQIEDGHNFCSNCGHTANYEDEAKNKQIALARMLITSGYSFEGYKITKYSGYISGDGAMQVDRGGVFKARNVGDSLMASLTQIRRVALAELKEAAYNLGCNAVIGVDFDYITMEPETYNVWNNGTKYLPYVFGVTANGNAVVIEKIED